MGVPAFFRWLSERYPKIMLDCVEEEPEVIGAIEVPVDITQPNPNNVEFDNLYLDMNGIIHPCFHPEDKAAPKTETEVFLNIFEYIDRLVALVRPRNIIYMAIDGVAPRAKMNQQRSRRFRAAADREKQKVLEAQLRKEFKEQGINLPESAADGDTFDSNVITPGTDFMDRLSMVLQWYVHKRLNDNLGWRRLSVVLSDSNTPGEGEHKFMQFIREQRGRPGWNGDTTHCVYGLDADLIHLALASHEPHFYILREVVLPPKHGKQEGTNRARVMAAVRGETGKEGKLQVSKKPFQLMRISVLREYLYLEFSDLQLPFDLDPERFVDDFVFMCFFVGNDFLPHMPTLDIREQGIELMMSVYRQMLPQLGGYLSEGADLNLKRVERFIAAVGQYEDKIFQARMRKLRADKNRYLSQKAADARPEPAGNQDVISKVNTNQLQNNDEAQLNKSKPKQFLAGMSAESPGSQHADMSNKHAASCLRDRLRASTPGATAQSDAKPASTLTAVAVTMENSQTDTQHDGVGVISRKRSLQGECDDKEGPRKIACSKETDNAVAVTAALCSDGPTAEKVSAMQMWDDLEATAGARVSGGGTAGDVPAMETEECACLIDSQVDEELETVELPVDTSTETAERYKGRLKSILKSKADMFEDMVQHEEAVRLGEEGWKGRYYMQKFGISDPLEQAELAKNLCQAYVRGLCWVMRYYFDGVASWTWYYPFHYAPFASDLVGLDDIKVEFDLGTPFAPFNQLMGVLPAGSKHALPKPLQPLFDDENSPILDFYPKDFKVDMNGKRFAWQGVALLPFIDEQRLLEATDPIVQKLPEGDQRRNQQRLSILLAHKDSPVGSMIVHQSKAGVQHSEMLLPADSLGYSGQIRPCAGSACPDVFPKPTFAAVGPDIVQNSVCMALYEDPPHTKHVPRIMPETTLPYPILTPADRPREEPLWCERHALRMNSRNGFQGSVGVAGRRTLQHQLPRPPVRPGRPLPRHATRLPNHAAGSRPFQHHPQAAVFPMDVHARPFSPNMHTGQTHMHPQLPGQQFAMPGASYIIPPEHQHPMTQPGVHWGAPVVAGPYAGQVQVGAQPTVYAAAPPVPPGFAGSLFAAMRPPTAQGPMGGHRTAPPARPWGRHAGNHHNDTSYGGGGYGLSGGVGRPSRHGNRFAALRDPRSKR